MLFLVAFAAIVIGYAITVQRKGLSTAKKADQVISYPGKSYPFSEVTNDSKFPHVRSIHTKIRGVTKNNSDGADRQHIIRRCCHAGDALFLVRKPHNPVDSNAIQVKRIVYALWSR